MKNLLICLSTLLLFLNCQTNGQEPDPIPEHETFTIDSKELNETRVLTVWLPEGYAQSEAKYPVMYMPDGGAKEDFPHIANTLAKLIQEKKIEPTILVGIENTVRRRDLTPPTQVKKDKEVAPIVGESAKFRAFIQNELFPEINKKYRTNSKKGIIGESLAGLFIMETFFIAPETFDVYITMDPSLWWNDQELVQNAENYLSKFPTKPMKFWFAGSDAKDISKYTRKLGETLENSAPKNLIWTYSDEPKEKHTTIYRATKEKALIWAWN